MHLIIIANISNCDRIAMKDNILVYGFLNRIAYYFTTADIAVLVKTSLETLRHCGEVVLCVVRAYSIVSKYT